MSEQNIEQLRLQIDELDNNIRDLIDQRMRIAKKIFAKKTSAGLTSFYDKTREDEIFAKIDEANDDGVLDNDSMREIFRVILDKSKELAAVYFKE